MFNEESVGKWGVKLLKECFDSKVDIKFYIQTLPYIEMGIATNRSLINRPKMLRCPPLESFS